MYTNFKGAALSFVLMASCFLANHVQAIPPFHGDQKELKKKTSQGKRVKPPRANSLDSDMGSSANPDGQVSTKRAYHEYKGPGISPLISKLPPETMLPIIQELNEREIYSLMSAGFKSDTIDLSYIYHKAVYEKQQEAYDGMCVFLLACTEDRKCANTLREKLSQVMQSWEPSRNPSTPISFAEVKNRHNILLELADFYTPLSRGMSVEQLGTIYNMAPQITNLKFSKGKGNALGKVRYSLKKTLGKGSTANREKISDEEWNMRTRMMIRHAEILFPNMGPNTPMSLFHIVSLAPNILELDASEISRRAQIITPLAKILFSESTDGFKNTSTIEGFMKATPKQLETISALTPLILKKYKKAERHRFNGPFQPTHFRVIILQCLTF